ncbi:MAG: hypothetical protein FJ265_11800 [Planctomycetes bacterium]|nr:hypothetical protein [Planctomycetota bacterium]
MTPQRPAVGTTAVAAALGGFACMAAELTAVRLLAPHFGDSAYVWTNVIGVILAALAGGAWLGGRLAGRPDAGRCLTGLLAAAGGLLALAPFVSGLLGAWLVPASLPLDAAMPTIVRGSFVATVALFAPGLFVLGAVAPMLVARLAAQGCEVGRAAGTVSGAGTLGSLLGTFAATHWLVPQLGCRATLGLSGACLLLVAALVARRGGRAAPAAAAMLLAAAAPFVHVGPLRPPPPGRELVAERESPQQFLQVLRESSPVGSRTLLVINEGLDSFHSVAVAGSAFTGGAYYDWHALAPLLVPAGRLEAGQRVLSIGDAAGSLRAIYAAVHPGVLVDAVDIDAVCMELGDAFFRGPKAAGDRAVMDGRVFLRTAGRRWQVIHVDAYAHQIYVPAHLASRQFFALARERLEPGGVLACNVGALHPEDPVLRAVGTTVAEEFGHALALQVPASRNFLLVARNGPVPDPAALAGHRFGGELLGAADQERWRAIVAAAAAPGVFHDVGHGGALLDDDRPQLDELLQRSYVRPAAGAEVVACAGAADPAAAEIAAYTAATRRDWLGAVQAVAGSRVETAYLREVAGDARYSLRELQAAAREYERAEVLAATAEAKQRLRAKSSQLAVDLEGTLLAERTGSRNLGLAAAACAAAVAALWLLRRAS